MTKDEYKKFCHEEFEKHGFRKTRGMYYRNSQHDLLCALKLQGSFDTGCYINCYYFIGKFENPKEYPKREEYDLYGRPVNVPSKDTYRGQYFMTPLIVYKHYTKEEIKPYFDKAFEEVIMPPIMSGKQELIKRIEQWDFPLPFVKNEEEVRCKLYS